MRSPELPGSYGTACRYQLRQSMLLRPIESGQYTSFKLAEHLDAARIAASIGSVVMPTTMP
ncbi:hypothetical protein ACH4UM_21700 [Streptomyces sp. NPDC020801]|uniref:hypothetical protein n=1 Tax=unclassified Streptomyces TaxID=2593676 RepID=UPI0037BA9BA5